MMLLIVTLTGLLTFASPKEDGPALTLQQAVWGPTNDFKEISQIAQSILHRFPPDQFLYIGAGRSPTPIIAMLRAIGGNQTAMNISVSNLGELSKYGQSDLSWSKAAYQKQMRILHHHLNLSLPEPAVLQGRKILVIDYAASGRGILETVTQVKAVAQQKYGEEVKIEGLALTRDPVGYWRSWQAGLHRMLISGRLHRHFRDRAYRNFSEYGRLDLDAFTTAYDPPSHYPEDFMSLQNSYAIRLSGSLDFLSRARLFLGQSDCEDLLVN